MSDSIYQQGMRSYRKAVLKKWMQESIEISDRSGMTWPSICAAFNEIGVKMNVNFIAKVKRCKVCGK